MVYASTLMNWASVGMRAFICEDGARAVHRKDDVVGAEKFAIVKPDAFPKVEPPMCRRDCPPRRRKARDDLE